MGLKPRRSLGAAHARVPIASHGEVYIRNPHEDDCDSLLELVASSRALHHPWVHGPETREHFSSYLARMNTVDSCALFVFRKRGDDLVGVYNISQIVRGLLQSAYLGYYGASRWSGHGYMSQGLRLVLSHAFLELRLHRLEANIQPDNAASRALVRRCGFRLEGFSPRYLLVDGAWRDHERWAITIEDWRARRRGRPD